MIREFETAVNRSYAGDNKDYSVDLQGVEDNLREGINDDTITLKSQDIQKSGSRMYMTDLLQKLDKNNISPYHQQGFPPCRQAG